MLYLYYNKKCEKNFKALQFKMRASFYMKITEWQYRLSLREAILGSISMTSFWHFQETIIYIYKMRKLLTPSIFFRHFSQSGAKYLP